MSSVVVESIIENEIAMIKMIDKKARNTFSFDLINQLINVFYDINNHPTIKAVIIYGYDNYFCCGGTQEELLNLQNGDLVFTDFEFYRLLLDCSLPTIAVMQGHAIGGGLAFGCYADIVLLAEESIYSANFMKYGFTPGMGATYIIPKKFGSVIGNELLYTANTYLGGILKNKGIPLPVVKKENLMEYAVDLARQLTDKPQLALKLLKKHISMPIKEKLPQVIENELAMHKILFERFETKQRILERFGQ